MLGLRPCRLRWPWPWHALKLTFAPKVGLKLREHAKHIEERFARRCARLYRLLGGFETRTLGPHSADDVLKITGATASRSMRVVDAAMTKLGPPAQNLPHRLNMRDNSWRKAKENKGRL